MAVPVVAVSAASDSPVASVAKKKKCKKGYVAITVKKKKKKVKKCVNVAKEAAKLLKGKKFTYYKAYPTTGGSVEKSVTFCHNNTYTAFSQTSSSGTAFPPTTDSGTWKVSKAKLTKLGLGVIVDYQSNEGQGSGQIGLAATADKVYVGNDEWGVTSAGC